MATFDLAYVATSGASDKQEACDINVKSEYRYRNAKQMREKEVTFRRYGPITKEGSAWLRWVMVQCAHVHLKQDTSITRAYHSIAQSKGNGVATVAAARRLLMRCYSVLKDKRPYYDPSGHHKT